MTYDSDEPINCYQCGNPLNPQELENNQAMCDRCWAVRSDYLFIDDWDEFEEEDETYTCEFCGGEYGDGWATCTCHDDDVGYEEYYAGEEPTQ